mgnify:FL=1
MRKFALLILCLAVMPMTAWSISDPIVDAAPPWTACNGAMAAGGPCAPGAPMAGTLFFWRSDGGGNINNAGIYECVPLVAGTYTLGCDFDMGLYPPYGGGGTFQLRINPAATCGNLCSAGSLLFSSNLHNCGGWSTTGPLTYVAAPGTACVVATGCGSDGWSCGGAIAIDNFLWVPPPSVDDWALY